MRGPNGVVVATAGAGAFASTPQRPHRQAKRRWRMTYGLTGGISISSYSPIKSFWASDGKAKPHCSQTPAYALGQDRLQTRQAEVFDVVALVLQFVLVDRQPQQRRRPAVAGEEVQSERG